MFIKLLTKEEAETCYKAIPKDAFKDGNKTQPLENVKKNKESVTVPEEVRKLIINKIYDTHYIDSVYCPNRVSVNYYNQYEEDDHYNLHIDNFKAYPNPTIYSLITVFLLILVMNTKEVKYIFRLNWVP